VFILTSAVLPRPEQEARIYDVSLFPQDFDREESRVIGKGHESFQENMATDVEPDPKPGLDSDLESGIEWGDGHIPKPCWESWSDLMKMVWAFPLAYYGSDPDIGDKWSR
jgi:hypothetical protein